MAGASARRQQVRCAGDATEPQRPGCVDRTEEVNGLVVTVTHRGQRPETHTMTVGSIPLKRILPLTDALTLDTIRRGVGASDTDRIQISHIQMTHPISLYGTATARTATHSFPAATVARRTPIAHSSGLPGPDGMAGTVVMAPCASLLIPILDQSSRRNFQRSAAVRGVSRRRVCTNRVTPDSEKPVAKCSV